MAASRGRAFNSLRQRLVATWIQKRHILHRKDVKNYIYFLYSLDVFFYQTLAAYISKTEILPTHKKRKKIVSIIFFLSDKVIIN